MAYFLSRDALIQRLDTSLSAIETFAAQVPPHAWNTPTDNPAWNVRDTLAHLASAGHGLLATAERIRDGKTLPNGFDLDYWNRRQVEKRAHRSPDALLAELRDAHERAKALLATLNDEELTRRGTHPTGAEVSVAGVFYLIPEHELGHLAEMARAVRVPVPGPTPDPDPLRKERLWWRLEDVRAQVKTLANSLHPDQWHTMVTEAWAVRDVIAHLAAAEKGHVQVGWALLRGEPTLIPDFDLDAYNNAAVAERRDKSKAELLAELDEARDQTAALLAAVTPEDWEKGGPHPGGFDVTVEGIFKIIALHERRHLKEVRRALEHP